MLFVTLFYNYNSGRFPAQAQKSQKYIGKIQKRGLLFRKRLGYNSFCGLKGVLISHPSAILSGRRAATRPAPNKIGDSK
jgi:hypothetical protein